MSPLVSPFLLSLRLSSFFLLLKVQREGEDVIDSSIPPFSPVPSTNSNSGPYLFVFSFLFSLLMPEPLLQCLIGFSSLIPYCRFFPMLSPPEAPLDAEHFSSPARIFFLFSLGNLAGLMIGFLASLFCLYLPDVTVLPGPFQTLFDYLFPSSCLTISWLT